MTQVRAQSTFFKVLFVDTFRQLGLIIIKTKLSQNVLVEKRSTGVTTATSLFVRSRRNCWYDMSVVGYRCDGMRCLATEALLMVGVAVGTVVRMSDDLATRATLASDGVDRFFMTTARQLRRRETSKYIA